MAEVNNPYLELTEELNRGRLRALLSSGQAVVVHRLAIMSKDGDWLLREDEEAATHALEVLSRRGANEERLNRYQVAAESWAAKWPAVRRQIEGLTLLEAHSVVTLAAEGTLPFAPGPGGDP